MASGAGVTRVGSRGRRGGDWLAHETALRRVGPEMNVAPAVFAS